MYGKLSVTRRMGERGPLASYSVYVLSVCSIEHVPAAADSCVICSGCVCAVTGVRLLRVCASRDREAACARVGCVCDFVIVCIACAYGFMCVRLV